jgi:hypothetical protein
VFEQSTTAMTVSSLQFPLKQASIEVSNIAYFHGIKDEPITVDNDHALDDDLLQMDLEADVNSVASYESVGAVDFFSENKFVDTTKSTCWQ